ncbi:MAG: chemotaxis protein CheW [Peptococcia bacterium]
MANKQFVVFKLADEEYGIDIMGVQEIIVPVPLTKIPNVPEYFSGVFNLRGDIIPLIDMRKRFGLAAIEDNDEARIVVLGLEKPIGILVDSIHEVLMIDEDGIENSEDINSAISQEFISGIAKKDQRLIILLNLEGAF